MIDVHIGSLFIDTIAYVDVSYRVNVMGFKWHR